MDEISREVYNIAKQIPRGSVSPGSTVKLVRRISKGRYPKPLRQAHAAAKRASRGTVD